VLHFRLLCFTVFALIGFGSAQTRAPALDLFDATLQTLSEQYNGYGSFDVNAARKAWENQVNSSCVREEVCGYNRAEGPITAMLRSLNDPHTYRLSTEVTRLRDREAIGQISELSLGLRLEALPDASAFVVTRVQSGGPAAQFLKRGDVITALNQTPFPSYANSKAALEALKRLEASGEEIALTAKRGNASLNVVVKAKPMGAWPSQLEMRGGVAVVTVYQFRNGGQVALQFHALLREAIRQNAKSLILDLRDCQGGLITEMLGVVSAFMDRVAFVSEFKDGQVQFQMRGSEYVQRDQDGSVFTSKVLTQPTAWRGRVAILTSPLAKSAPEYVAHILKTAKRARVFGEATLGALNTTNQFFPLPDGSSLAVTVGRSMSEDLKPFPARVTPNEVVRPNLGLLTRGRDVQLERAWSWLERESR
jgi:C-terminal processing protease CtpA/Prc